MIITNFKLSLIQKQQIILGRYNDKSVGHPRINKIIELVTRDFLQLGVRKDVEDYVKNCDTCRKVKYERYKPYGLLQVVETLEKLQSIVALDFIVKLPSSREPLTSTIYDLILVISDNLTKISHFIPWKEKAIVEDLAYIFTRYIIFQYGIPEIIKLDRGLVFTLQFQ